MKTEEAGSEVKNQPIRMLIQALKDGTRSIKTVDEETRLECVQALRAEECTTSQIAQIFNMSDRQVRRYSQKLREQGAIVVSEQEARELLGELRQRIENNASYLIRLSRDKDTSAADKIQALDVAMGRLLDLGKFLQSAGCLPLQPQLVAGEIHHHFEALSSQDLADLKAAVKASIGLNPVISKLIEQAGQAERPATEPEPKDQEHAAPDAQ